LEERKMSSYNSPDSYPPSYGTPARPPYGSPAKAPARPASKVAALNLAPSQWLLLAGGLLTIVGSLLPWYSLSFMLANQRQSAMVSGWDVSFGKATALLGLLTLALVAARFLKVKLPAVLATHEAGIYLGLGAETFFLSLLYLLDGVRVVAPGSYYSGSPALGLYLVLVGAAIVVAGGYLAGKDQGGWPR
jgi:hypothetical protein